MLPTQALVSLWHAEDLLFPPVSQLEIRLHLEGTVGLGFGFYDSIMLF